jgi:hypothetical protein
MVQLGDATAGGIDLRWRAHPVPGEERGGGRVTVKPDARVHDYVALDEIELYGELMIAASRSDGPLSTAEIDAVLGVTDHSDSAEPLSA